MSSPAKSVKQSALEVVSALPDNCTFNDIHYHLYAREKIESGLEDIESRRVLSHEEAMQRMRGWKSNRNEP